MSEYGNRFDNRYERSGASRYAQDNRQLNWGKVLFFVLLLIAIVLLLIAVKTEKKPTSAEKPVEVSNSNAYYLAMENNKWGVIDEKGKEIIPCEYDDMVEIPNQEKDLFIVTSNVNYSDNTYDTIALNNKKEQVLTDYNKIKSLSYKGENGDILYIKDKLTFEKEGKIGVIDSDGNVVLEANFDKITTNGKVLIGVQEKEEKTFDFFGKEIEKEAAENEAEIGVKAELLESISGYTLMETGNIKYYSK